MVHAVTFLAVHAVIIINTTHSARLGIGVLEIQCNGVRTDVINSVLIMSPQHHIHDAQRSKGCASPETSEFISEL